STERPPLSPAQRACPPVHPQRGPQTGRGRAGYPRPVASGTEHVSPQIHDYVVVHSSPPDPLLRDLIEETAARFPDQVILQIGPEQGTFMTLLSRLIAPRRAIEVGTFTGYSSI